MLRIEFERLLRPSFLDEAKQPVQHDDAENDRCVDPQAEHQLGEACTKQDVDQDIIELRQEADKRPLLLAFRQPIGTVFFHAAHGLPQIEARFRVGGELLHHLVCCHGMPSRYRTSRPGCHQCIHGRSPSCPARFGLPGRAFNSLVSRRCRTLPRIIRLKPSDGKAARQRLTRPAEQHRRTASKTQH